MLANRFEEVMEMIDSNPKFTQTETNDLVRRYVAREWASTERDTLDPDLEPEEEVSAAMEGVEDLERKIRSGFIDHIGLADALGDKVPPNGTPELQRVSQAILRAQREVCRIRAAMFAGRFDEAVPRDPMFVGVEPEREDAPQAIKMGDAVKGWEAERQPKPQTVKEFAEDVQRFTEVVGDKPVDRITRADVGRYKDAMTQYPRRPRNELRKLPVPEVLKAVGGDPAVKRLSPKSVESHLTAVRSVLGWAVRSGQRCPLLGGKQT